MQRGPPLPAIMQVLSFMSTLVAFQARFPNLPPQALSSDHFEAEVFYSAYRQGVAHAARLALKNVAADRLPPAIAHDSNSLVLYTTLLFPATVADADVGAFTAALDATPSGLAWLLASAPLFNGSGPYGSPELVPGSVQQAITPQRSLWPATRQQGCINRPQAVLYAPAVVQPGRFPLLLSFAGAANLSQLANSSAAALPGCSSSSSGSYCSLLAASNGTLVEGSLQVHDASLLRVRVVAAEGVREVQLMLRSDPCNLASLPLLVSVQVNSTPPQVRWLLALPLARLRLGGVRTCGWCGTYASPAPQGATHQSSGEHCCPATQRQSPFSPHPHPPHSPVSLTVHPDPPPPHWPHGVLPHTGGAAVAAVSQPGQLHLQGSCQLLRANCRPGSAAGGVGQCQLAHHHQGQQQQLPAGR